MISRRTPSKFAVTLSALTLCAFLTFTGCVNTADIAIGNESNMTQAIVLPAPTESELAALQGGSKGEPHRVGTGRSIPAAESRFVLSNLPWKQDESGSYTSTVSVQSVGARSVRARLRLNVIVPGLTLTFRGSTATLRGDRIVSTRNDVFWSPVLDGDTVSIELKVGTPPKNDAVLEIPVVSHLP